MGSTYGLLSFPGSRFSGVGHPTEPTATQAEKL